MATKSATAQEGLQRRERGAEKTGREARGAARTLLDRCFLIRLPMLGYVVRQRIIRIRRAQQRLRTGGQTVGVEAARGIAAVSCSGPPECSITPSGSARPGSTCPSKCRGKCGPAGQCSDGRSWSGTGPVKGLRSVSRAGAAQRSFGWARAAWAAVYLGRRHRILFRQEQL